MDDGSRTDVDMDALESSPSMNNLLRSSNDSWATSQPPPASSNRNDEENIEMVELGESQQHTNRQRITPTHYEPHWIYLLIYLALSMFNFCSSIIHLLKLSHELSYTISEYLIIPLDLAISAGSLIIFCMVFPFTKRKAALPNRTLVHCLICSSFKLASATIIFGLQHDWLMLTILINCFALFILLCAPRMMSNFKVVQNL